VRLFYNVCLFFLSIAFYEKKKKRERTPTGRKTALLSGKKKISHRAASPFESEISLSSTSTSSLLCALREVMVPLIALLQAENDEEADALLFIFFYLFPSSSPSTETFFLLQSKV